MDTKISDAKLPDVGWYSIVSPPDCGSTSMDNEGPTIISKQHLDQEIVTISLQETCVCYLSSHNPLSTH